MTTSLIALCPPARVARLAAYAGVPIEEAERLLWAEEPNHIRWLETASDREIALWLAMTAYYVAVMDDTV